MANTFHTFFQFSQNKHMEEVKIEKAQVVSNVPLSEEERRAVETFIQSGYACNAEVINGE